MSTIVESLKDLESIDIFAAGKKDELFVGRPFYLDYDKANLLITDFWKQKVGGIGQGTFILAFYENENNVEEALLLRALRPSRLPTEGDVMSSMIDYYKNNVKTAGKQSQLDEFTRYEFSFSGLECRILGTLYKGASGKICFGADVENYYSAHNYAAYKITDKVLGAIANFRLSDAGIPISEEFRIGRVRYSSSQRVNSGVAEVPVFVTPKDFLGKRTALFGMTRTGKSNTVKKIIQATVQISKKAKGKLSAGNNETQVFDKQGLPTFPVGQIIFDINGEYANPNLQDEGTAIFELYKENVVRYSVFEKPDFEVMKVNFYSDVLGGLGLVRESLKDEGDYVQAFLNSKLELEPEELEDRSLVTRTKRREAVYLCCLHLAGFPAPAGFKIKFAGNADINQAVQQARGWDQVKDPAQGLTPEEATEWFSWVWENSQSHPFFQNARNANWLDEDLKNVLIFLTRKRTPGGNTNVSGYLKLKKLKPLHTSKSEGSFEDKIVGLLNDGKIVIVDLSQGDPEIQRLYSDRICRRIFQSAMKRFTDGIPNNFIQFYFEEAHNLFPKKEDRDLSQIYNRLAKEGAKLSLGLLYATQEVSSISSNILKNTQNWFVAHLNNDDELKELRKYYDFADFAEGLLRFSPTEDQGFVRMKTYSNPFIVPVQIGRFSARQ